MSLKEFRLIPQYSNFSRRVNHLLLFRPDIPRVSQSLKEVLGKLEFGVEFASDSERLFEPAERAAYP